MVYTLFENPKRCLSRMAVSFVPASFHCLFKLKGCFFCCAFILLCGAFAEIVFAVDAYTLGGRVVDTNNQPIADLRIDVLFDLPRELIKDGDFVSTYCYTDPNGRWETPPITIDPQLCSIAIETRKDSKNWHVGDVEKMNPASLLNHTHTLIVCKKLQGKVITQDGKPVSGCRVSLGYPHDAFVLSDPLGRFEMNGLMTGSVELLFEKEGCAFQNIKAAIQSPMKDFIIPLRYGKFIQGYVVDPNGTLLGDVTVKTEQLFNGPRLYWTGKTDPNGHFYYNSAPDNIDGIHFSFNAEGRIALYPVLRPAGDFEYEIVLYPQLRVSGTVTDAQTGLPIPAFTVNRIAVCEYNTQREPQGGTNGKFEAVFNHVAGELYLLDKYRFQVEIEAEGYLPSSSEIWPIGTRQAVFNARLTKNDSRLTVLTAPNKPAANARVFQMDPRIGFTYCPDCSNDNAITTDSQGGFSLPETFKNNGIVIVHDEGFRYIQSQDLQSNGVIYLEPFARIEGTLYIDGKPAANQMVSIFHVPGRPLATAVNYIHDTQTDARGHYVFEKVPPISVAMGKQVKIPPGGRLLSHTQIVHLHPGITSYVDIKPIGRKVVGNIVFPDDPNDPDVWNGLCDITIFNQKYRRKIETAEDFQASLLLQYPAPLGKDRFFSVSDIPAGDYVLEGRFYRAVKNLRFGSESIFGTVKHSFVVEIDDPNVSQEPIDLGGLIIQREFRLRSGQPSPDFTMPCLDGTVFRLSEQKGNYVLLRFWTIGYLNDSLLAFRDIVSVYGQHPALTVVGVANCMKGVEPKAWLAENKIFWPQIVLEFPRDEATWAYLRDKYGLQRGMHAWVLIGPDQKVLVTDEEDNNLTGVMARCFSKPPEGSLP